MEACLGEVEAGELVFPLRGTEASADTNHEGSLSYLRTGGGSEGFPEGAVLLLLRGSSLSPVILIHIIRSSEFDQDNQAPVSMDKDGVVGLSFKLAMGALAKCGRSTGCAAVSSGIYIMFYCDRSKYHIGD